MLRWLDPQRWPAGGYFRFGLRYCAARHNGFGWDLSGASNLPELSALLRSTVMIRRIKAEVLPQLPPKIRTVIALQPVGGMRRILRQEMDLYRARYLRVDSSSINWDELFQSPSPDGAGQGSPGRRLHHRSPRGEVEKPAWSPVSLRRV